LWRKKFLLELEGKGNEPIGQ
jgi:hypothetical protein